MAILLSFLPWIIFLGLPSAIGSLWSATIAAGLAGALVLRDARRGRLKALDIKGVAFFLLFLGAAGFVTPMRLERWSPVAGSAALFTFALSGLLLGRPFTVPYAKEMTESRFWETAGFRRANQVISSAWLAGFALALGGSVLAATGVLVNALLEIGVQVAAIAGPLLFQSWFRRSIARRTRSG
jgi:hypothetical protein